MMRDIGASFYYVKKYKDNLIMNPMKAGMSSPLILSSFVIEKKNIFYRGICMVLFFIMYIPFLIIFKRVLTELILAKGGYIL